MPVSARGTDEPHFRDLGTVLVEQGGSALPLTGRRLTAALSLLLVHANERTSTDALIDALWGDAPPSGAKATLSSHLFRLRRALETNRARGSPFATVVHDAGGYRLVASPTAIDSQAFEEKAEASRDLLSNGHPERALVCSEQALALWRGRPWSPHSDLPWAAVATARLEEVRAQLRERRAQCRIELGYLETALTELDLLVAEYPLREQLWAQRMRALYQLGRTGDALGAYQRVRAVLIEELGVEPGPALRDLHRRVLAGDPALGRTPTERIVVQPSNQATRLLPRPQTTLRGRTGELSDLASLMSTQHLLSIVGPPGVGKTRLVIEAAHRLADEFPDGVFFIDLVAVTDPDRLLDAIASALGLQAADNRNVQRTLKSYLDDRRMLLILDSCDHLIELAATLIDDLLATAGEAVIAVTSRRPLELEREHVWVLDPLPVTSLAAGHPSPPHETEHSPTNGPATEPAIALFVERAAALGRTIQPDQLPSVADICVAVDGLPLAIELAAARTPAFSLREITEQVRADASSLARIGNPDGIRTSLADMIDQSLQYTDVPQRRLHRAVSVVPGPFTAEVAGALVSLPDDEIHHHLADLVHRSLLVPLAGRDLDRPSRFQQLSPVRAHASQSTSAEQDRVHIRRRDAWVLHRITQMPRVGSRGEAEWFQLVDDDLPAVNAFLRRNLVEEPTPAGAYAAARLGLYWYYRGMVADWERWTTHAVNTSAADSFDRLLAGLSLACALGLAGRGDLSPPYVAATDEVALEQFDHDQVLLLGDALFAVTTTARGTRDTILATRAAAGVRRVANHSGDDLHDLMAEVAALLAELGVPDPRPADLDALMSRTEVAYARAIHHTNRYTGWMIASVGATLGILTRQPETGLVWSQRAIDNHVELGATEAAGTLTLHGMLLASSGQHLQAAVFFAAARHQSRRSGMRWPRSNEVWAVVRDVEQRLTDSERAHARRTGHALTLSELASTGDPGGGSSPT